MASPDLNELRRVLHGGSPSRPSASTGSSRPPPTLWDGMSSDIITFIFIVLGLIYGTANWIHSTTSVTTRVADSIQSSSISRITSVRPPAKSKITATTLGLWYGIYGSDKLPTTLHILSRTGNRFNGRLTVHGHKGIYRIAVEGTLPGDHGFDFQETRVISHPRGANWILGINSGMYERKKERVSGRGNDPVHFYTWAFRH